MTQIGAETYHSQTHSRHDLCTEYSLTRKLFNFRHTPLVTTLYTLHIVRGLWTPVAYTTEIFALLDPQMQRSAAQFRFARQLSVSVRALGGILTCRMWLKCLLFFALGVSLKLFFGFGTLLSSAAVFAVYLVTGGWRFAYVVVKTLPRDAR